MKTRKGTKSRVHEASNKVVPPQFARYMRELPSPLELAKLAAAVGPHENWEEAIRNAAKLYWMADEFCERFQNATPKERAFMFEDWPAALHFDGVPQRLFAPDIKARETEARIRASVPPLEKETATLKDFLEQVVKAKTPADATKRLRDFFRSVCPKGKGPDTYAERWMTRLNKEGFTNNNSLWEKLGLAYRRWWIARVAEQNRTNRKRRSENPDTSEEK